MDPEIPVLSLIDLGVIRSIEWLDDELHVGVSPTYSGCPATRVIRNSVLTALNAAGFDRVKVYDVLSPPWSSDWISQQGRNKLYEYGIAPPVSLTGNSRQLFTGMVPAACPRCGSAHTTKISEFGSTPCKAHYRCNDCLEPFDYFKCI
jgi:ring-1,2-phenylacetyl-CoA epoxidase subunit PaaD